ncbi:hypothetical protein B9Z55_025548 [Caenorhabditis nigoni]|uniref:Uncharacterized protein n=1 Tax=Caenorhabditis nigoni TaxID=1611254 RepID=A0A2G5SZB0_9PELO|nr:hypothetical protein B9Z55_025548 [Caenorhabditis nigoni]
MRLFIIATIAIVFAAASGEDNITAAVTSDINSTAAFPSVSSDSNNSTFGDIDDSSSDDFFSDETINSIHTNANGIGTFKISSEEHEFETPHATGTLVKETHQHADQLHQRIKTLQARLKLVEDAYQQADRLIQCWEPIDPVNATSFFILSEPIFTLCSYIPLINAKGNVFAVNGLESEYDDPLLSVFEDSEKDSEEDIKPIVLCVIEKFQFHKPPHPPSTTMRCLCNQPGCNVPKPLEEFLNFNRNSVSKTNNGTTVTDH